MRQRLTFTCEGETLSATLDSGSGTTGLLIVSGGNEIRIGSHRGMAKLAADVAAAGQPVFRFDRRGIGDSTGENGEFHSSGPDINAALQAFRVACPHVNRVIAFGNCDAASALLIHGVAVDGLVLSNIWVIEGQSDLPPPAAIRARYAERLRDPKAWIRLFSGAVNLKKLAGGLMRLASPPAPSSLADKIASAMAAFSGPMTLLLANRDNTAIAFLDAWNGDSFAACRKRETIAVQHLDSASHSYASDADYAALMAAILTALSPI